MPVLEIWLRFGTRGDSARWERVQFAVMDSPAYKLIAGIDMFAPRGAELRVEQRVLLMKRAHVQYALPLKPKEYVFKAPALIKYHQVMHANHPATSAKVHALELSEVEAEGWVNHLDAGSLHYAASQGLEGDLHRVLWASGCEEVTGEIGDLSEEEDWMEEDD